jgi:hypothetical protein
VVAVIVSVMLARLLGVMRSVHVMPVRHMSMVTRSFVVTGFMVFGGSAMMLGGVLVMFCSFLVVYSAFFGHV